MHRIFRVKAYEAEHGPHFNEEHARKAVSKNVYQLVNAYPANITAPGA